MIRKLLVLLLLYILPIIGFSQAPGSGSDCTMVTPLNLVVGGTISTGQQTTQGLGNNHTNATTCGIAPFYGQTIQEDGFYSINITNAGDYSFAFTTYGTIWKSLSIYSGCVPTAGNCVAGFATAAATNGALPNVTLGIGTYYLVIDNAAFSGTTYADFELEITSPIVNDLCSSATTLNCGDTIPGSTTGSTNIASGTGCTISNYGVWYTFVGDGDQTTISATSSGGFDHEMSIVSGSCGGLTNITCQDFGVGNGTESYTFTTTNGTTYYVYIAHWLSSSTTTGDFIISRTCVPTTPPPNDECSGALGLTVNADQNCGVVTSGTTNFATASPQANDVSGTPNNDVWFSFVATNTSHTVSLLNVVLVNGSTDMGIGVYNGSSGCSALSFEATSDPNTLDLTGLTIGDLYYVRVYGWFADPNDAANFDVCVGTPPPPPSNDECSGAIGLTVNPDRNCGITTPGTTVSATASPQADDVTGTPDNDVWFSFVATSATHTISLLNIVSVNGSIDMGIGVYNGSSGCGALVFEDDSDPNTLDLTGLTIGDVYYVRIYGWFADPTDQANFNVCVGTPPPPPPNDEPCNAIALTPGQTCAGTSGYVEQATNSGIDSCFGTPDNDVWYSFVATATNHTIRLQNVAGNSTDMFHAVYGSFTPPDCSVAVGDNISCSDADVSTVAGLTIGATYYVQVFTYFAGPHTTIFDICITEPCSIPAAVATDACPFVDVTPDASSITSCGAGSASETLTADFLDLGDTSDYDVERINYDVTSFANFAAAATNPVALSADDTWSDISYAIPFDFCYYGNTVNQFVVGANSMVTFNTAFAGQPSGYSFNDDLPSTNGDLFANTIYASYHDIDPGVGGSIRYGTTSANGCNALVVIWDNVPMFFDNTRFSTSMLVMYENTNIIEVYIEEKVVDGGAPWNGGNAIVGVQNAGATQAVVAPCRNSLDDNWTAINESWRFTPSGGASIANLQWLVNGVLDTSYDGQTSITVSPSSTTNYTAQVTYNLCNGSTLIESDVATITVAGGKVWDGSTSNDWMEPTNWSDNLVPTPADCVIIPVTANDPIIYDDDNGDGLYMIIETGATLTLTSDTDNDGFASSVTIQDYIDIQGTGQLIVEDDASLIQVYDSSTAILPSASNSGNITLYRDTDVRLTDYVYWSSPVQGFDISNVYGGFTPTNYSFLWLPTIATGTFTPGVLPTGGIPICYGNWDPYGTGAMALGKGYIVRAPTNHSAGISTATAIFSGVANNGVITQQILSGTNSFGNSNYTYNPYGLDDLTVTPFDDNWNLLGNPYPSALDAQSFLTHPSNSIIEGAVHIWTHGTQIGDNGDSFYDDYTLTYDVADYTTYNFSGTNSYTDESFQGKIASGQGFFVLALNDNESGSVTFNNSMRDRSHRNTAFYRNANEGSTANSIEKHRIWLNLKAQNGSTSSILVGYIEGATQDKDRLFDAYTRDVNSLSMYSKIGDQRMIIQGRALPFDQNDQVPLGTVIPQAGQYTIAISNVDGLFLDENQNIYLEDTHTGVVHDLRAAPYTFTETEAVDYQHRFILRYTNDALSISDLELSALTIMAPKGDYIKINSDRSPIDTIVIYDLLGRVLFDKNSINTSEFILNNHNLSSGTYIVKATLVSGVSKAQKIVLKN